MTFLQAGHFLSIEFKKICNQMLECSRALNIESNEIVISLLERPGF